MRFLPTLVCLLALAVLLHGADAPAYRTDADGPSNKKVLRADGKPLEWFKLVDGEFPPEGSGHAMSGELILVEHPKRTFHLRVDRDDSQDRGRWDLPLEADMLPYGSIFYHGSWAALADIPLGTHLRGLFYWRAADDKTPAPEGVTRRGITPDVDFRRCFRLEDDFSFFARQKQLWKIESVADMKLTARLQQDGQPVGEPRTFELTTATRIFQGTGAATLVALKPGQEVLFNLTWATLYGPGRITDLWLDAAARDAAAAQQREQHRLYVRDRGLPAIISAVDDDQENVTVTLFNNVDPTLFEDLKLNAPIPKNMPPDTKTKPGANLFVAEPSLQTYDPQNDRKGGEILETKTIPAGPGCSGLQLKVKVSMMLEGYRPRRIVIVQPATWIYRTLPMEEQLFGRE
ncbi:MAG TPA: hypothetical protein VGO11_11595 [Chthoniobacteraceae bacterium]|jgi:hypothetical protein|nr:hypothetical protein [Chthoniobacteraceae bacterium]